MSDLKPVVSSVVAPEDISPGDYLAILTESFQLPSYLWSACDSFASRRDLPVTIEVFPYSTAAPRLVKVVTLPLLLVKDHTGQHQLIDVRRYRFARIRRKHARRIWQILSPNKKPREFRFVPR